MALFKEIRQPDGVVTNYHRILCVTQTINVSNSIAVLSYVDIISRENDKLDKTIPPYKQAITYFTNYDPTMTIEKAYDYLKTLPEFEGAADI